MRKIRGNGSPDGQENHKRKPRGRATRKYQGPFTSVSLGVTVVSTEEVRSAMTLLNRYAKERDMSGQSALVEILNKAVPGILKK